MSSKLDLITFCVVVITLFFVGYLLIIAQSLFMPIVLAIMLTVLLSSIVSKLKAKKVPRYLIFPIILLGLVLGSYIFLDIIVVNINQIIEQVPLYQQKFNTMLNSLSSYFAKYNIDVKNLFYYSLDEIKFGKRIQGLFGGLQVIASDVFLVLLYIAFFFFTRHQFTKKFVILFKGTKQLKVLDSIFISLQNYIYYKSIIAFLTAVFTYISLWILGIDFPLLWSLLTFLFYFIPTLGSIIVVIIIMIFTLFQYMTIWPVLGIGLFLLIVHNVIGNILEPKLLGDKLNINAVFILIVVIVGGMIRGIIGMLLAVPILSIVNIICSKVKSLEFLHIILRNEG